MNAMSKEEAIVVTRSLNLPDVVFKIIDDKVPDKLVNYFSTPMVFDLTSKEQAEYGFGKILPLWSTSNGDIVFAYDFFKDDYFSFNWSGDVMKRFPSWNELISDSISRVMEITWDEQSEDEIFQLLTDIFTPFEIKDINSIFQKILK
ncbi:hypothetical protein [Motilimonas pumila]|uniref:Uncharacterized protein n=1 Tax=Motilimonas pumila TaxID=2303987 RepID=A0A418Y968_9GAMM|nr:hypothetical protein [Motilimonas pumila]RJG36470.1 hypothetical protein D1Z90_20375 [Motilimonas pumila]